MNKKQRDRKNKKRAIRVDATKFGDRTVHSVEVQFLMTVGGKPYNGKRFHYRRGRATMACDLEQLANIITMWERTMTPLSSNTFAYDFLKEVEGKIENRSGLTARQIFEKHWVHFRETIEEEFERKNKGIPGEMLCKHENDFLKHTTALSLDYFTRNPLPLKMAFLYAVYRWCYATDGFDGMRQEIEQIPQYIKDIVDELIAECKKEG